MNVHETIPPESAPAEAAPAEPAARSGGGFWDFKQVSPLRSMVCFGFASALGLGIAGFGLFTAKGTVTHVVPPENVALVNQRPILRTDFIAQAEAELGKPFTEATTEERLKVLDEMLREELFVQRGLELDFPGTDPDTRTALVAAVEQQVVADVTTHQPSDAELMKYFEDNRANYSTEGTMALIKGNTVHLRSPCRISNPSGSRPTATCPRSSNWAPMWPSMSVRPPAIRPAR